MRVPTLAASALVLATAHACSDFRLNSTVGGVMSGRTMDFAADLASVVEVVPRGTLFQELPVRNCAACPDYNWTSTYGFVAFNMFGLNVAADGMNEHGLSAAELYLVATQYPTPAPLVGNNNNSRHHHHDHAKPIITSVCSYILGNFATVADVLASFATIQIAEADERITTALLGSERADDLGRRVPLHISVHDATGASLVIEYIDGVVTFHNNANGVLTNDPPFPQQLAALQANGLDHIPGGYGSTDRFVRLSVLNRLVPFGYRSAPATATYLQGSHEQRAVSDTLHLLNSVVRPPSAEATEWSVVRDHSRKRLYIQSTVNQVLRQIDVAAVHWRTEHLKRQALPVTHGAWFVNMTPALLDVANTQRTVDLPARSKLEALIDAQSPPPSSMAPERELHTVAVASTSAAAAVATTSGSSLDVSTFLLGCVCGAVLTSVAVAGGAFVWFTRVRQRGYASIPSVTATTTSV